jgi:hypothetical protein
LHPELTTPPNESKEQIARGNDHYGVVEKGEDTQEFRLEVGDQNIDRTRNLLSLDFQSELPIHFPGATH